MSEACAGGPTFPPRLDNHPRARPESVIVGAQYRISVLADGLLRLEWSDDDEFEDRASSSR